MFSPDTNVCKCSPMEKKDHGQTDMRYHCFTSCMCFMKKPPPTAANSRQQPPMGSWGCLMDSIYLSSQRLPGGSGPPSPGLSFPLPEVLAMGHSVLMKVRELQRQRRPYCPKHVVAVWARRGLGGRSASPGSSILNRKKRIFRLDELLALVGFT